VQSHPLWMRDPVARRAVGAVYVSFLLPALMGLLAQVGGTAQPAIWRVSFVVVAAFGCFSTLRLLRWGRTEHTLAQLTAVPVYVLIAVVGAAPELAKSLDLKPIQAEALLLIMLVVIAHVLAWQFMVHEPAEPTDA
jgi:hypothetical protein